MSKKITTTIASWAALMTAFVLNLPTHAQNAQRRWKRQAQHGMETVEVVLLIVGAVLVVGIVIGALTGFINGKIALWK